MNPIAANLSALRNIMTLKSRASLSEYWWVLATFIGGLVLGSIINSALFPYGGQGSPLHSWLKYAFILFIFAGLLANFTVSVRRLHDTDKSGWWMATLLFAGPFAIVPLIILCSLPSTPGSNRFGPNPNNRSLGGR